MGQDRQFNLADLYESLVDTIPDRLALVSGDRRLTFSELDLRANRLANFFRKHGLGTGDHVGLHLYNGNEFVEAMLAAFKIRAVPINLNYRYVADELRYLCENADLKAIVTEHELLPIVEQATEGNALLEIFVSVGESREATELVTTAYEEIQLAYPSTREFGPRSGDDLYIIYTGGTTGMPSGVMWRHEDVFFAGLQGGTPGGDPITHPEELAHHAIAEDYTLRLLPAAPFIHGAAQWSCWIGLFTGGTVILQPGRSFQAARIWELVEQEQVSTLTLVGDAMASPLLEALEANHYRTDSLVVIASAGAILSPTIRDALQQRLPDTMILNNFGATEVGHQGSAIPGEETGHEGRPSFFMDETNTVLDDDLRPIEPGSGRVGRLARCGRVPLGYYRDEQKTKDRFIELDGTRWVLPGDYATIETDGRITVFGRGSVCINTGGEKVFPEEVEETLKRHPEVRDALVVGIPDPKWMQRVVAVVEPKPGCRPTPESLDAHCRRYIAGYKVPRQLILVEQVARQPSGKPDYRWAREQIPSPI